LRLRLAGCNWVRERRWHLFEVRARHQCTIPTGLA
jgi:hypothetical protein